MSTCQHLKRNEDGPGMMCDRGVKVPCEECRRGSTIYISGPMTGKPDMNFPAFHAAAARMRDMGYTVYSPAELPDDLGGWTDYMRACLVQMSKCTSILMLPGWESSKGATLEHHIAWSLNMAVFYDERCVLQRD